MTNKSVKDFYLMHYVYYFYDGSQRGEGNLYLSTPTGTGVRKAEVELATNEAAVGLQNNLQTEVVVVVTNISYLTSCTEDEFNAP